MYTLDLQLQVLHRYLGLNAKTVVPFVKNNTLTNVRFAPYRKKVPILGRTDRVVLLFSVKSQLTGWILWYLVFTKRMWCMCIFMLQLVVGARNISAHQKLSANSTGDIFKRTQQ